MASKFMTASYVIIAVAIVLTVAFVMLPQGAPMGSEPSTVIKTVNYGAVGAANNPEAEFERHSLTEDFDVELVTEASVVTGIDFTSDGRMYFVELGSGKINILNQDGSVVEIAEIPEELTPIDVEGEAGVLDIELDPQFDENGFIYVYYSSGGTNKVARIKEVNSKGEDFRVIFDGVPQGIIHNGGELKFGPDGKLYLSTGDATVGGEILGINNPAQDIENKAGKVLRMNPDGSLPEGNPFPNSYAFAYGIRNIFGYDFQPNTGKIFAGDNGIDCCDELNIIEKGKNYGWPVEIGITNNPEFGQPIYAWSAEDRVAPTKLAFANENELFMGTWRTREIYRFTIENYIVTKVDSYVLGDLPPPITGFHAGEVHEGSDPRGGVVEIELGTDGNLYFSERAAIYKLVIKE
jgi:glucose/arabinose dehydrogenase